MPMSYEQYAKEFALYSNQYEEHCQYLDGAYYDQPEGDTEEEEYFNEVYKPEYLDLEDAVIAEYIKRKHEEPAYEYAYAEEDLPF